MNKKRSLQRKSKKKVELVAGIVNIAAPIKQEHQDDLRRAARTIAKRVEKCIEVDGGIFNTYFEMLQFVEIIYITNKCNQQVICLSSSPFVSLFMRSIQTPGCPHPLKIGHMSI
jgi:hypothetical protein